MSENKVEMIEMELTAGEATLDNIFKHYIERCYNVADLPPEEIHAIKMVFYSGAAAIVGVYSGVMEKTDELIDAENVIVDMHGADSEQAQALAEQIDECADALAGMMHGFSEEVDALLVPQDDSSPTTADHDLANWYPAGKAN